MLKLSSIFAVSTIALAQSPPQQIPATHFYWPTGSSLNTSQYFKDVPQNYGTWLGPDTSRSTRDESGAVRVGNYLSGYYHLGYDILNPTGQSNQPIYAIADGVIFHISYGNPVSTTGGWGSTTCAEASAVTGVTPSECNGTQTQSANVGLIIRHKKSDGSYFYAIYGHLIDANYTPQTIDAARRIKADTARRVFREQDVILAGQQLGVTGNWDWGRHLHFSVAPFTSPTKPLGKKSISAANWPDSPPGTNYLPTLDLANDGTYYNQVNPIDWITNSNNQANNYLSAVGINPTSPKVQVIPNTTTYSALAGSYLTLPSQLHSVFGFTGTALNSLTAPSAFMSFFDTPKQFINNQAVPNQNKIYIPPGTPATTYQLTMTAIFQDNVGNTGASTPASILLQVLPPGTPAGVQGGNPVLHSIGTVGGLTSPSTFTVFASGAFFNPSSIRGMLQGAGCSTACIGTTVATTNTSYVGTFTVPGLSGDYEFRLQNGGGTPSNPQVMTIYPTLSALCTATASEVAVNTPVTFNATESGGLAPYSLSWDNAVVGGGTTITSSFASGGVTESADLTVTDYLGNQAHSSCLVQVDLGSPTISLFGIFGTPESGTSFDGAMAGSSFGSNLEVWFCLEPNDTSCFQQPQTGVNILDNSDVDVPFISLSAGSWRVKVRNGPTGPWSNLSNSFTVGPAVLASCSISPNVITLGQGATIYASSSGGVAPYHFFINSVDLGSATSLAVVPSMAGLYTGTVTVIDGAGVQGTNSCTAQVNPASTFTIATLNGNKSVEAGQAVSFDLGITPQNGFTGTVNWQLAGLPTSIVITNSSQQVTVTLNGASFSINLQTSNSTPAGTYNLLLTVSGQGVTQTLPLILGVTLPLLSAACSISPNPIIFGQGGTVTAQGSSGVPPYQYQMANGLAFGPVNTIAVFPTQPGSFTYSSVTVRDSQGQTAPASCSAQVIVPQLTVNCSISPNPINLGNGTTIFATASGGMPGYLYSFNGGSYQSTSSAVVQPQNGGTYTATISAKDAQGTVANSGCSATVNGIPPTVTGANWDSPPKNNANFSGNISGTGFTPDATVWFCVAGTITCFQQPPAGVMVNGLTFIRVVNVNLPTGSWQVEVRTPYGNARSAAFSVSP